MYSEKFLIMKILSMNIVLPLRNEDWGIMKFWQQSQLVGSWDRQYFKEGVHKERE